jgi:cytochrome P450
MAAHQTPSYGVDSWSDDVILNPYPHYEAMRAIGSAVWLTRNNAWTLTRYETVRPALLQPEIFSSAKGCMMNEPMNLFSAADDGLITEHTARMMLVDYPTPSLDTTINPTSAAFELFANNPDQWDKLRLKVWRCRWSDQEMANEARKV